MTILEEYIELASKNFIPSDKPITAEEAMKQLATALNLNTSGDCGLLGSALSRLKVKYSYRYKGRPEVDHFFPKKTKQYFVALSVGNGNLVIDKAKLYRWKAKARKTIEQKRQRNYGW
jgi:hypothetical protein